MERFRAAPAEGPPSYCLPAREQQRSSRLRAALKGGATPDQSAPARLRVIPASADLIPTVKRLYAEKRWDELVRLVPVSSPDQPAELDYYRGMALARLERWKEAKEAFE